MSNWGDLATWVGSVVAVCALGWGVFLYVSSLRDKRRDQAALLAFRPDTAAVQQPQGIFPADNSVVQGVAISPHTFALAEESEQFSVYLKSESNLIFHQVQADLIGPKSTIEFPLGLRHIMPNEERSAHAYLPRGTGAQLGGSAAVRFRFMDSNGRFWEKTGQDKLRGIKHL